MAAGKSPRGRQLSSIEKAGARAGIAHGVRIGAMSQHRRMLEPSDGDIYVAG